MIVDATGQAVAAHPTGGRLVRCREADRLSAWVQGRESSCRGMQRGSSPLARLSGTAARRGTPAPNLPPAESAKPAMPQGDGLPPSCREKLTQAGRVEFKKSRSGSHTACCPHLPGAHPPKRALAPASLRASRIDPTSSRSTRRCSTSSSGRPNPVVSSLIVPPSCQVRRSVASSSSDQRRLAFGKLRSTDARPTATRRSLRVCRIACAIARMSGAFAAGTITLTRTSPSADALRAQAATRALLLL